jgi:hypothetical protein
MTARRKSSLGGLPEATEPRPPAKQTIPSVATASTPPSVGGTDLMIRTNAKARHSTQRVLSLFGELEGCGNCESRYPIFVRCFKPQILFTDFMIPWTCSLDYRTGDNEESVV